ncbi:MAG: hypothetical protein KF754_08010 [Planctomycetes bacterium]|nr:hypothetical protein [Planctomycetota bacterium]
MTVIRFEQLKINPVAFGAENGVMKVTFRCPISGQTVEASAPMAAQARPAGLSGLWQSARNGATRMFGAVLGDNRPAAAPKDAEQAAIVAAFDSVRAAFHWDEKRGHFVAASQSADLMNPFDVVLRDAPLARKADREIAARVMWDVIRADAEIRPAEQSFVEAILGKKIAAMRDTPEVSKLDIDHLSADCRGTVLMLAVATALSDEHRHAREQQRVSRLAEWLDVRQERQEMLRNAAAQKVIENVLLECYSDGVIDDAERARLTLLAERLGVNEALVGKVDVRLRQRRVQAGAA